MTKTKIIGLTAVAMIVTGITAVAGVVGITKISAAINSGEVPTIITNLANRFNLNTSDIQKVFDETKTQQEDARLTQLVTDGKITEAQKKLITDKSNEIKTKIDEINNKQMTSTERGDALKALRDEIVKWANDNKIDERFVMMGGGMGRDLNFGGPMMGGRKGGFMGER
jgi:major membrane immunogen (membrane-anchored lipoprotein)